jgi:hypothetical protein
MSEIHMQSVPQAVSMGALVDLASDYRTSQSLRGCLPHLSKYPFAISSAAFRRHLQIATPSERQFRMEAICRFLGKWLELADKSAASDLEFRFPGGAGQTESCSLKLVWYATNQYWVLLLPDEELHADLELA